MAQQTDTRSADENKVTNGLDALNLRPDQQAPILRLPNELLQLIFEFATAKKDKDEWDARIWAYSLLTPLAEVSRRFNSLVLPMLYGIIDLNGHPFNYQQRVKQLHDTLKQRPELRSLPRSLQIEIEDEGTKLDFPVIHDLVVWATGLTHLRLYGGFGVQENSDTFLYGLRDETCALVRSAGQCLPALRSFDIFSCFSAGALTQMIESFAFKSLEKLEIWAILEDHNEPVLSDEKVNHSNLFQAVDLDIQGAASFTSLSLNGYSADLRTLFHLTRWPKKLVHFTSRCVHDDDDGPADLDFAELRPALLPHLETLQTIELQGPYKSNRDGLFNAAEFPNLESFKISRWAIAPRGSLAWTPEHADLLLAPRLKVLTWVVDESPAEVEEWDEFSPEEEKWMREFAKVASQRRSTLQRIHIQYKPETYNVEERFGYPWDRMDKVREEIRPYGVALGYDEPPLSKKEWQEEVDSKKERMEREALRRHRAVLASRVES
ncbi:F-box domain protein [Penicillium alfredii]|uniref:F-box domain protein n=1 Tax=Penicillium alfredii TaxID=1506179 RepID=A0A9W9K3I9_9EURO|nr:F-box domain protein [Penicillium alfredii]KAJ5091783.1 F-box domain protein [Penicillium alfredii]